MMIEDVEIRDSLNRDIINIIDDFSSVIWNKSYYSTGDFELHCVANKKNINLLKTGRFVTRADDTEIGLIEKIVISKNIKGLRTITASGRFSKCLLERRHIYHLNMTTHRIRTTEITGNVETAVRGLINDHAISSVKSERNFDFLELGASSGTTEIIVDENGNSSKKQISYSNLLTYTDEVLKEYGLGARIIFNRIHRMLQYSVYTGKNRSIGNTDGNNEVIFSEDIDSLTDLNYTRNIQPHHNTLLIGGEGQESDRFYTIIGDTNSGLDRKEIFVDFSSVSKKTPSGTPYTDAGYNAILVTNAVQKRKAEMQVAEDFKGTINWAETPYRYGKDFNLGDIVSIFDNDLDMYVNARITGVTVVQDESGYREDYTYEYYDSGNDSLLMTNSQEPGEPIEQQNIQEQQEPEIMNDSNTPPEASEPPDNHEIITDGDNAGESEEII